MRGLCLAMWATFLLATPPIALGQEASAGTVDPASGQGSLGPGDFIALEIWREPDLSDTVQVDREGVAVFPKLGPIEVTGMRPDSLERLLVRDYGRYLQNPSIRVTVQRRITIWGAVQRPGPYPVDLTMTVTDALTLAGGPTPDGKPHEVELRRGSGRTRIDLSGQTPLGETPLRSGDQLFVPQRSWFARNTGLALGAVGTITSLVFLIIR